MWHTEDVHTGLNSGGRYNQSFLWSNHLHNEGERQRVTRLLWYPTTVTGIQGRMVTGALDKVRG
jgi:hypothetical protein